MRGRRGFDRAAGARAVACLAIALLALSSCAYYNTFYLAQKYYKRGSGSMPYPVERADPTAQNEYRRSTEYSKKLLSQYPKSKWVDDAYLLWARALLGQNDPLKTVEMLETFSTRFADSDLRPDASFYLGVGYLHARRYHNAALEFDGFIESSPKHDLIPFAYLERSRTRMALERYAEAADDATQVLERHNKSGLEVHARVGRAEALLKNGEFDRARDDFRYLGARSRSDEERLGYLFREAECLETARKHDEELALLQDALSHEVPPVPRDTSLAAVMIQQVPGADRYGRILMRMGTAHLLAGRPEQALAAYRRIVVDYAKTPLAAEAQYRVGYTYETALDDFDAARAEYDKVKEHAGSSGFGLQAYQRLQALDRLAQFRNVSEDSTEARAEGAFLLAEQYLFELNKPDRALEEYQKITRDFPGTPAAGKALNAEAWVMRTRMGRPGAADTLHWKVVYEYPGTEAQLAARDYLERSGYEVPSELIKLPEPPPPPPMADTAMVHPPESVMPAIVDTLLGPGGGPGPGMQVQPRREGSMFEQPGDSLGTLVHPDSIPRAPQPPPPAPAPAPADTTRPR
jgi:tetratricopeptide (TPR) repeat protein